MTHKRRQQIDAAARSMRKSSVSEWDYFLSRIGGDATVVLQSVVDRWRGLIQRHLDRQTKEAENG